MKELIVISGKGGSGKTSVVASFAILAGRCVSVDCDVDAADLHLVLEPKVVRQEEFTGGCKAKIHVELCTACGRCAELCRFDAIHLADESNALAPRAYRVESTACEGCGVCADRCEHDAVAFAPTVCGRWFISETRCGPMVHAKLGVAADNSGKLVTRIRRAAQEIAVERGLDWILCDGSPGIGCPVIASLTGASMALFVVEPTVSGIHDFRRVAQLAARLAVPGLVAVNKADLNPPVTEEIEALAVQYGIASVGRIPYDPDVTHAQLARRSVVESSDGPASQAIRAAWKKIRCLASSALPASAGGLMQIMKN